MKKLSERERKLLEIMRTSTDAKEILETASKLGPEPWTLEKAEELAELNGQDKPKFRVPTPEEADAVLLNFILGDKSKNQS